MYTQAAPKAPRFPGEVPGQRVDLEGRPSEGQSGGKIAFTSLRDGGNWEIYVMAEDGSNPVNLTKHPAEDGIPSWSPDGTRIAFVSSRDDNIEIYVMDADGGNPVNLTNHAAPDGVPAWSSTIGTVVGTAIDAVSWDQMKAEPR